MKVEEEDTVDGLQTEVPGHIALFPLAGEGAREIIDDTVAELRLISVLHLHDEFLAVLCLAQQVVDDTALIFRHAIVFLVEEGDVLDGRLGLQQIGQEGRHHLLVAEDFLEAVVGQNIDVSVFSLCHIALLLLILVAKLRFFSQSSKSVQQKNIE